MIKEISEADLTGKNFVFVYFEFSDANTNRQKPLLICLSKDGTSNNKADPQNNKWYKRNYDQTTRENTWQNVTLQYTAIKPVESDGNTIDPQLVEKLGKIKDALPSDDKGYDKPDLVVKLDYAAKGTGTSDTIKYRTGDKQVTVEGLTATSTFKGYKHYVDTGTINKLKIHGHEITQINGSDLDNKKFVFVYYSKEGDDQLQKPYLICLAVTNGGDAGNRWYKRTNTGGVNKWIEEDADSYSGIPPGTIQGQLETNLKGIKTELNSDTGYPSASNDIDASVIPTNADPGKEALYGIRNNQITVSKGTTGVPDDYVRYTHMLANGGTFDLNSVKHNGHKLEGIVTSGQSTGVTAVYVYYKQSGDDNHEFPLIVCVKKSDTDHPYYKRGQRWSDAGSTLNNVDPDTPAAGKAGGELARELDRLKDKYEIKIEVINTTNSYKGRPGGDITVGTADVGDFKGYSHSLTGTINRITHYGKPIRGIPELDSNGNITIDTEKKVWVFYQKDDSNRGTPLLLYFQKSGATATNNWYGKGKKWELHKDMKGVDASGGLTAINKPAIEYKLNAILRR